MKIHNFIILIILLILVSIFIKSGKSEVVSTKSDIDNKHYLVRDVEDKKQAANLLASVRNNIITLADHLNKHKDTKYEKHKQYIDLLCNRIYKTKINESKGSEAYTSYSINKGEQIVFCLRSKENNNELHDINLIMYVALHEIAHVACPEYNHTPLFKDIFRFITKVAIELKLYKKVNFSENHHEYCGIMITESII